jgi:hypothetical protein
MIESHRAATLRLLLNFLEVAQQFQESNGLTNQRMSGLFGPLVIRPHAAAWNVTAEEASGLASRCFTYLVRHHQLLVPTAAVYSHSIEQDAPHAKSGKRHGRSIAGYCTVEYATKEKLIELLFDPTYAQIEPQYEIPRHVFALSDSIVRIVRFDCSNCLIDQVC